MHVENVENVENKNQIWVFNTTIREKHSILLSRGSLRSNSGSIKKPKLLGIQCIYCNRRQQPSQQPDPLAPHVRYTLPKLMGGRWDVAT